MKPNAVLRISKDEWTLDKSRQLAEDFAGSQEDFLSHDGRDLIVISESTLRCDFCWVFDFSYTVTEKGKVFRKYISVVVEKGKAHLAIPKEETNRALDLRYRQPTGE